jgi:hypothetical protein
LRQGSAAAVVMSDRGACFGGGGADGSRILTPSQPAACARSAMGENGGSASPHERSCPAKEGFSTTDARRCTRIQLLIWVHLRASVVDFSRGPTVRPNVGVSFDGSACFGGGGADGSRILTRRTTEAHGGRRRIASGSAGGRPNRLWPGLPAKVGPSSPEVLGQLVAVSISRPDDPVLISQPDSVLASPSDLGLTSPSDSALASQSDSGLTGGCDPGVVSQSCLAVDALRNAACGWVARSADRFFSMVLRAPRSSSVAKSCLLAERRPQRNRRT